MQKRCFEKPSLGISSQINLYKSRGLHIPNPVTAGHHLKFIGYYRLSGYAKYFSDPSDPDHAFYPNASFDDILNLYFFDREMRIVILEAIEILEVAIRSIINNHMSNKYGNPHWYTDANLFRQTPRFTHKMLLRKIEKYIGENKYHQEVMLESYYKKYDFPQYPPCWIMAEAVPIGVWSLAFAHLDKKEDKKTISAQFARIEPVVFQSWLHSLTLLRNLCAHHARVWNRVFVVTPKIIHNRGMEKHLSPNTQVYAQLSMINVLLNAVSKNSEWKYKLFDLLNKYPNIPLSKMGFPNDWEKSHFWNIHKFSKERVCQPQKEKV